MEGHIITLLRSRFRERSYNGSDLFLSFFLSFLFPLSHTVAYDAASNRLSGRCVLFDQKKESASHAPFARTASQQVFQVFFVFILLFQRATVIICTAIFRIHATVPESMVASVCLDVILRSILSQSGCGEVPVITLSIPDPVSRY